jgi:3-oxoacyl-[acyl-carrier protein] reductase
MKRRSTGLSTKHDLSGEVAIVTGASRGIGRAIAIALAHERASITVNYLKEKEKAEKTVAMVKQTGVNALSVQADVREHEEVQDLVRKTCDTFGRLDILVNNAGVISDALILNMDRDQWNGVISTNLTGVYSCSREAVRIMTQQGGGRIVNIASVVGQRGNIGQVNYAASKAGVIGLTKALAREFATKNITVNAVAPGFVKTDMTKDLPEKVVKKLLDQIPMGRFGRPEEIAEAVVFLVKSTYVTGQIINLNGGMY